MNSDRSSPSHCWRIGSLVLHVSVGDLFTPDVDAIVNSEQTDFVLSPNPSTVSGQIRSRFGEAIQAELDEYTKEETLPQGTVLTTTGADRYRRIYHAGFHHPEEWLSLDEREQHEGDALRTVNMHAQRRILRPIFDLFWASVITASWSPRTGSSSVSQERTSCNSWTRQPEAVTSYSSIRATCFVSPGNTKRWRSASMPSLDSNFKELRQRLRDSTSLRNTGGDPVYYLVFPPQEMLHAKRRLKVWKSQLKLDDWDVEVLSLAKVIGNFFATHPLREFWLGGEQDFELAEINETLRAALVDTKIVEEQILEAWARLEAKAQGLLIVTDIEALHPYLRIGAIEQHMQGKVNVPTVILYPGMRRGQKP